MEGKLQLHLTRGPRRQSIQLEGISFGWSLLYNLKRIIYSNLYIIRSLSNLHSQKSRSMKSVKIPWYQKPILHNNKYFNVQRGSMLAAVFSFVSTVLWNWFSCTILYNFHVIFLCFMYSFCPFSPLLRLYLICTVCRWQRRDQLIMDITLYRMSLFTLEIATVSSTTVSVEHYISFDKFWWFLFQILVRNILVMFALFSFLAGLVVFVTSIMLTVALRKVSEFI